MKKLLIMMSLLIVSAGILTGCNKKVADTADVAVDSLSDSVDTMNDSAKDLVDGTVDTVVEVTEEAKKAMDEVVDKASVSDGYQDFEAATFAKALEEEKKVVLFFHADRCPSCIALDEKINEDLKSLPANLVVFKLDYDTEKDLKKLYKVRKQHTLVYLDADGNATDSTTGVATVEQLLENL